MMLIELFEALDEGVYDPHIFKCIFLIGGPGSGKTYMSKKMGLRNTGMRYINLDQFFEILAKKKGVDQSEFLTRWQQDPSIRRGEEDLLHQGYKKAKKKKEMAIDGRLGLIIDGTGRRFEIIAHAKEEFENLGYECLMLFVNTNIETAEKRNIKRGAEEGRRVDIDFLKQAHNEVRDNIGRYYNLFDGNVEIVDNVDLSTVSKDIANDLEIQQEKVWKKINKFINAPPSSYNAKKWIEQEKEKKRR